MNPIEKAQFVLMKKGGFIPIDGRPTPKDFQRYRDLYKKKLLKFFIQVVTALVDAASPRKVKEMEVATAAIVA